MLIPVSLNRALGRELIKQKIKPESQSKIVVLLVKKLAARVKRLSLDIVALVAQDLPVLPVLAVIAAAKNT